MSCGCSNEIPWVFLNNPVSIDVQVLIATDDTDAICEATPTAVDLTGSTLTATLKSPSGLTPTAGVVVTDAENGFVRIDAAENVLNEIGLWSTLLRINDQIDATRCCIEVKEVSG